MSSNKRMRSRSPRTSFDDHESRNHSRRSRSKLHKHAHHRSSDNLSLPNGAPSLSKHDLESYKPLFALYLDTYKQLDLGLLSGDELKGRWKSFIAKWNRGELAKEFYEPKAVAKAARGSTKAVNIDSKKSDLSDEEEYGPVMPDRDLPPSGNPAIADWKIGPAVPSLHDLQARQEESREDDDKLWHEHRKELRSERSLDRKLQRERLDELVPRAEAGTRERQLEKKQEKANSNRAFAAAKDGGHDVELRDSEVMGDEDSLSELKRMKKEQERKKTEREIRREEILRARTAEREERVAGRREKERKTMEMFHQIARARFGGEGEA